MSVVMSTSLSKVPNPLQGPGAQRWRPGRASIGWCPPQIQSSPDPGVGSMAQCSGPTFRSPVAGAELQGVPGPWLPWGGVTTALSSEELEASTEEACRPLTHHL